MRVTKGACTLVELRLSKKYEVYLIVNSNNVRAVFAFRPGHHRDQNKLLALTLGFDANSDERRKCPQVSTYQPGPPILLAVQSTRSI